MAPAKQETPNPEIKSIANKFPRLKLTTNQGQRHRLVRPDKKGSLWIIPQSDRWFVKMTGDAVALVLPTARKHGDESEDDGYPVVYIDKRRQNALFSAIEAFASGSDSLST